MGFEGGLWLENGWADGAMREHLVDRDRNPMQSTELPLPLPGKRDRSDDALLREPVKFDDTRSVKIVELHVRCGFHLGGRLGVVRLVTLPLPTVGTASIHGRI